MTELLLYIAKFGLRFLYLFVRPFRVRNKLVFFSRQSSDIPLDFQLLADELRRTSPETELRFFCRKMRRRTNVFTYALFLLRSLYHLSTCAVAVTDTYSIQLCTLRKKADQTYVQIWHALGAVKQFSYQCLDRPEGQTSAIARAMDMHRNYDYVLCASRATRAFYAEGFRMPPERIAVVGMPRVDVIRDPAPGLRERYLEEHPALRGRKLLLYLPTFREEAEQGVRQLTAAFAEAPDTVLLVKPHPMSRFTAPAGHETGPGWSTYDLMKVCHGVVTDYSAASLEASLLNKPVYLYLFDCERYAAEQGLNIDLWAELPRAAFREAEALARYTAEPYDYAALAAFRDKYVETAERNNTADVAAFLLARIPARLRREKEPVEVS